jgi:enoyl-CoA hydratase/carnithine racemase
MPSAMRLEACTDSGALTVIRAASWAQSEAEGAILMQSADAAEGPRAFAEKRAPHWQAG